MADLFENQNAPADVKFDDLVGEGKKFRDPDAVAKKVVHADQHIERLEKEMAELRAELQARTSVEEMLNKIQRPQTPNDTTREMSDTTRQETGSKQIDLAEEVQKLVRAEKEKERAETNIEKVRAELKNRFGADYNQKLESIASALEVSKEFLVSMAKSSPSGFLKLIDSVAKPDNTRPLTPPASNVDPFKQAPVGVKDYNYYRELRQKDPNLYFSKKIQNEMHAEALRQGPSFYGQR
jgi:hypothetical protein